MVQSNGQPLSTGPGAEGPGEAAMSLRSQADHRGRADVSHLLTRVKRLEQGQDNPDDCHGRPTVLLTYRRGEPVPEIPPDARRCARCGRVTFVLFLQPEHFQVLEFVPPFQIFVRQVRAVEEEFLHAGRGTVSLGRCVRPDRGR